MRIFLIILSFVLVPVVYGQKENSLIRQGNKAYNTGKYEEAEKNYRKALEMNRESFPGQFNLGTAVYQKKNYKESANIYSSLAGKNLDKKTKAKILHNLGNSLLEGKEYEKSIAAYKNALLNDPSDIDTKYNLEYAKMMLKKQQQQQQQQNQKKDQKDQKDKQDQNQKDKQDQQKQPPDQKKISKEDAERMLEAMKNDEKKTMEKVNKEKAKAVRVAVEKDW
ncbi:MAG TPA: tetratricopeptide repeat protein [Bacteroidales bacterium]|nr:tetratricopeptide repeat protein [Bacteroidales bacterium]HPS74386.1 tetratricopeptide repeat protein [Bacteroidales bacterium]